MKEQHGSIYITMCKIDDQIVFSAGGSVPKAGTLGKSRGIGCGGRWRGFRMRGIHVYL